MGPCVAVLQARQLGNGRVNSHASEGAGELLELDTGVVALVAGTASLKCGSLRGVVTGSGHGGDAGRKGEKGAQLVSVSLNQETSCK